MSDVENHMEVLSDACEKYLAENGLFSLGDPKSSDKPVEIHLDDGPMITKVTATIDAFDLKALVEHGQRQYREGVAHGKTEKQYEIRAVLGMAS